MRRNTNSLRKFVSVNEILIALCFLMTSILHAQTWTMPVDGKVLLGNEKLTGAIVTLYKNGQQLQQVVTTSNGKFSFELPPNAEYLISITKPGYIMKKFKIVTANVPADRAEAGGFNPFEPDVTLFEMPSAPEISKRIEAILSQPIAVYQFIPSESNFNYDEKYTQVIQDKIAELTQLQKQAEKEMKEKVKNAALEAQKQLEVDKKYKAAIAKADASLNAKNYPTAKAGYAEASGIKPSEAYPKTKLGEIDKLLADANKQKELDLKYQAAIAKGDNAFNTKDYTMAKAGYAEASGIKPSEAYPKTKLGEIDKLLSSAEAAKQKEQQYKDAIAKADAAFGTKDYAGSKSFYAQASVINPLEQYPKTKLAEIDKLLAEISKAGELDKQYKELITKADNFFLHKNYASARSSYSEALSLKSLEQYPKTKLAEIDKLLADLALQKSAAEKEQQYKDVIAKADKFFALKEYSSSKSAYSEALNMKSAEQYPKTKIAEIDKLLDDLDAQNSAAVKQKEIDEKYKTIVAKGDNAFNTKDYLTAKAEYTEASGMKPNEAYPKTKLTELDKLIADAANTSAQQEIDVQYQDAIEKGDHAFSAKDYNSAKTGYKEAAAIKPLKQYPKDKLAEIEKIEKNNAATQQQANKNLRYSQAVENGDKFFLQKDYRKSKQAYQEALSYKPDEKYPKDRISQIDDITKKQQIAENVRKDDEQHVSALSPEEKKKVYQLELRSKYPNGVTQEEILDNGKIILRRVVVRDDFAGVYLKVTHSWGGVYCFKDNAPITEMMFENETK